MMIIFQNKLIYLPYIPYGARNETIQDYTPQLLGLDWTSTEVRTRDGKKLSTCVAEIRLALLQAVTLLTLFRKKRDAPEVIVVYFQGYHAKRSFSESLGMRHQCHLDFPFFHGFCGI